MSLKSKIKDIIPNQILFPLQKLHGRLNPSKQYKLEAKLISDQSELHHKAVERVRLKQGPINVVFFAIMDSVWKYDILYQLMEKDNRFNPTILVCPAVNYGRENMLMNMDKCYNLFKQRGYNVIRSYNEKTDQYVEVRKELAPDIIFYTNPYEGLIDDRYFIKQFTDVLTCYVTYSISETQRFDLKFGSTFSNLLWKHFIEFSLFKSKAKTFARNGGINIVHSGFPGIDRFIKKGELFMDAWKIKYGKIKRIIWAPHHTITDYVFVNYSTFLDYYDFMFEMAKKYKDHIQIAFKPHPLLKNRLDILWGHEKTQDYYDKWASLPNGLLNDSAYEDLFMTSDAMIHDCGSFITEYLYTKKPALFLSNGRPFKEQYNEMAQKCLDNYYIGKNKEDIEDFIVNVINNNDSLKEKREEFFQKELLPPNGKLASENIIDNLIKELRPEKS